MKRVIFFDCFGVLVSEVAVRWFKLHYSEKEALRLKDEIFVPADRGEVSEQEAYDKMASALNISPKEVEEWWDKDIRVNYELVNYIRELNKKYDVYLLSNAISSYVRNILDKNNLNDLFKKVYISSEIKLIKPNKDYFEYVLNDLSLKESQCVMIDDSPKNIKTCIDMGLNGIVFNNNLQLRYELEKFLNNI